MSLEEIAEQFYPTYDIVVFHSDNKVVCFKTFDQLIKYRFFDGCYEACHNYRYMDKLRFTWWKRSKRYNLPFILREDNVRTGNLPVKRQTIYILSRKHPDIFEQVERYFYIMGNDEADFVDQHQWLMDIMNV